MSDGLRIRKKGIKSVACQRCHSRKVKCSGGNPCLNCRDAEPAVGCVYPSRDRKVKLSQQYVEHLLKENELLRNGRQSPVLPSEPHNFGSPASLSAREDSEAQETARNPLIEERSWFHGVSTVDLPILIGEAADGAYATRFRQTVATVCTNHLLRTSFVPDAKLDLLSENKIPWPSAARARFLVKVALNTVCRYYHMVLKSAVLGCLEEAIRNGGGGDRLTICKLLALFAIGEAYSARSVDQQSGYPGLTYFSQARKMASIPVERPDYNDIEVMLLFTMYSLLLNRRHSAYVFASSAVRLGLIMGMQVNVPEHQYRNRRAREHRIRLWWSAYVLDRSCASKLGLPVSIADDDILVDLPSGAGLSDGDEDFGDFEYEHRSIQMSRMCARSIREIYSRRQYRSPFSQRVQSILKDLTRFMDTLPEKFHLRNDGSSSLQRDHIVYLHLRINQCILLVTRPILLTVLRIHRQSWTDSTITPSTHLPESARTLAETCTQCARHSYRMITDAWIHGTFATFGFFNTQYLFSASIILAVSSLLGTPESQADGENFDNAAELLKQLAGSGNLCAKEYVEHVEAIRSSMAAIKEGAPPAHQPVSRGNVSAGGAQVTANPLATSAMTAGMALADPLLQGFLADTNLDMQALDNPALYGLPSAAWPEVWGDDWLVPGAV